MCAERKDPLDDGGPLHLFVMEAFCIAIFTVEFLLRLLSAPATIGMRTFACSVPNWIDFFAIAPFYVDIVIMHASTGGDVKFLAVMRLVRLSRIGPRPRPHRSA